MNALGFLPLGLLLLLSDQKLLFRLLLGFTFLGNVCFKICFFIHLLFSWLYLRGLSRSGVLIYWRKEIQLKHILDYLSFIFLLLLLAFDGLLFFKLKSGWFLFFVFNSEVLMNGKYNAWIIALRVLWVLALDWSFCYSKRNGGFARAKNLIAFFGALNRGVHRRYPRIFTASFFHLSLRVLLCSRGPLILQRRAVVLSLNLGCFAP